MSNKITCFIRAMQPEKAQGYTLDGDPTYTVNGRTYPDYDIDGNSYQNVNGERVSTAKLEAALE